MGNGSPLISVIMPSLNVGKYIEQCLKSVIGQTLDDLEIICVDAGSTDATCEILDQYARADSRISIVNSDCKSYGYQVNLGIKLAKGEYIGIVDTDDFVAPDMYEKLYSLAQKAQAADYVKSSYYRFLQLNGNSCVWRDDLGINRLDERIDLSKDRAITLDVRSGLWAGIYRRAFLIKNEILLNETPGATYQDIGFNTQVKMLAQSAAFTDEALYYYRIDNQSASVRNSKLWHCVIEEWKYARHKLLNASGSNDLFDQCTSTRLMSYGWNFERLRGTEYQSIFLDEIYDELIGISKDQKVMKDLTPYAQSNLQMMLSRDYQHGENSRKAMKKTMALLNDNSADYVLLPAGTWSERLLSLQELTGRKSVIEVCDNSIEKVGKQIGGYTVTSIDETVRKYADNGVITWMIASKNHSEILRDQLLSLGIDGKKIAIVDDIPDMQQAVEIMMEGQNED